MAFMLIRVGAGLSIDQALHLSVNFDNRMLQPQEAFTFLGNLLEQTFLNTQELASTSPTAAHLRSRSVLNVFPPPLPAPAPSGDEGPAWSSGGGGGGPGQPATVTDRITRAEANSTWAAMEGPKAAAAPGRGPKCCCENVLPQHAPLPPNTNYI